MRLRGSLNIWRTLDVRSSIDEVKWLLSGSLFWSRRKKKNNGRSASRSPKTRTFRFPCITRTVFSQSSHVELLWRYSNKSTSYKLRRWYLLCNDEFQEPPNDSMRTGITKTSISETPEEISFLRQFRDAYRIWRNDFERPTSSRMTLTGRSCNASSIRRKRWDYTESASTRKTFQQIWSYFNTAGVRCHIIFSMISLQ